MMMVTELLSTFDDDDNDNDDDNSSDVHAEGNIYKGDDDNNL